MTTPTQMQANAAPTTQIAVPVLAGQHTVIKGQPGQHHKMMRASGVKAGLVQSSAAVPGDNVIAIRQGDDLLLRYDNGSSVTIEGFYATGVDASTWSVEMPGKVDDAGQSVVLTGETTAGAAIGEGGTLVYAHGSKNTLLAMAQGHSELSNALSSYSGLSGEVASTASAAAGAASFSGIGPLGLLGIVGGVVTLKALADFGSVQTSYSSNVIVNGGATTLSGTIVAGQVIADHQLSVSAFQANGTLLAADGYVDGEGRYTLTFRSNYVGAVLLKVIDASTTGTDYMDEATGAEKSLSDPLYALAYMITAGAPLAVNITPLTDLAATELGRTNDSISGASTAAAVAAANVAVANFFGLNIGGEQKQITEMQAIPVLDALGNLLQAADPYGNALASISGAERQATLSTAAVLEILSAGIVINGTTAGFKAVTETDKAGQTARILLLDGVSDTLQSGVITIDNAITLMVGIFSQNSQTSVVANLSSLTDGEIAALTPAEVAALTSITDPTDLALLSAAQLTGFRADQVLSFIENLILNVNPAAVAGLRTEVIQSLTGAQVDALSTDFVIHLNTAQLAALNLTQVQALSSLDMRWLSTIQRAQIDDKLSDAQIQQLVDIASVAALDPAAVALLAHDDVTGLSDIALLSFNAMQFSALTAEQLGWLSPAQLEFLTPVAINVISTAAGNSDTHPALSTYSTAGVTGVDGINLAGVNSVLSGGLNANATDTVIEIQSVVDAYTVVQFAAADGPAPTQVQLETLGIAGITADNLSAIQAAIAASADDGFGLDTWGELQDLVMANSAVL